LFMKCIDESEKSDNIETRLDNLISFSTTTIYRNICRGLFERHKLLFSSMICFAILKHREDIKSDEWGCFMRGAGVVDRTLFKPNPNPQNISEQQWDLLNALEERVKETGVGGEVMFPFKGVVNSLCSKYDAWVKWIASDSLFTDPLPDKEVSERSERALMKTRNIYEPASEASSKRSELVTTSVQTRTRATTNPLGTFFARRSWTEA